MTSPADDARHGVEVTDGASLATPDVPFVRPAEQIRREQRRVNFSNRQSDLRDRPSYAGAVNRGSHPTSRQQTTRSSRGVMGSATNTGLRAGPLPSRGFFVSRVHKDDGVDSIKSFLQQRKVNLREIRLASHPEAMCNSFKISVSLNDAEVVSKPDFWETGIRIRKWQDRSDEQAHRTS